MRIAHEIFAIGMQVSRWSQEMSLSKKKVSVAMVPALHYSKCHQGIKNPIHLFYEVVPTGDDGKIGDDRDIHYHCLHDAHKVCTIKKKQ
jgi:hypothetical protein